MKTILGRIFTVLLVISLSFTSLIILNVKANPLIFPDINQPTINIQSPIQYQTYQANSIWLNFTVHKPEDWINNSNLDNSSNSQNQGQITFVTYSIDKKVIGNETNTRIEVYDPITAINPQLNFSFSVNLNELSDGNHTVEVYAEGIFNKIPIGVTSTTNHFTVYTPDPTPVRLYYTKTIILGTIIILILLGILAYYKKNRK